LPWGTFSWKKEKLQLPRLILDEHEVKRSIKAATMHTNDSYRNRVILEILFDNGGGAAEMANIETADLDLKAGYLTV
jgi:site-specific recombinase XerD